MRTFEGRHPWPALFLALFLLALPARAQYVPARLPLEQLPQERDDQRILREFMATLREDDFEVERRAIAFVPTDDPGERYRFFLLSLHPHPVTSATLPASAFTLRAIEGARGLVMPCPPLECQMLAWLARWEYPGNVYRGSRPLQLRAFMLAAIDMMMLDYLYAHDPQGADRADFLGGNLIWIGYTYLAIKDSLPAKVRTAFETGLKRLVRTIHGWGPTGKMTDMDLFAPVGLRYIAEAVSDPEIKKIVDDYARALFTDERFFNPAGYFVDNRCFDTSYNGISLYFGTWAALLGDWKFARDAIDQAYRLRAHLSFPDPDGSFSGPSAMASRCSGDPPHDQWNFAPKTYGSGMVTDEALHLGPLPSEGQLEASPDQAIAQLNAQLAQRAELQAAPWQESHWSRSFNYAYECCPKGYYARRLQLARESSPWLEPLYRRDERFVREFGKAFVIARLGGYAAAIHTGPVAGIHEGWQRPYGHGGGQLCAFWTPKTGSVLLTRRRGIQGNVYDSFDEWRTWPVHTVAGITSAGEVITSGRIQQPDIVSRCSNAKAEVRVSGTIPKYVAAKKECVPTDLQYARRFRLDARGVRVVTTVKSGGRERLAELYETIPIFLRENVDQKTPRIQFQVGKDWVEATDQPTPKVKAVRIERFDGAVQIVFSRPITAKLSPQVWLDGFQTRAECRTLLVNLLQAGPGALKSASVDYTLSGVMR